MKNPIKCNKIECQYVKDNGILGKTKDIQLLYTQESINYTIEIFQAKIRKINISSDEYVEVEKLFEICEGVEKLLMIFDGQFYPLKEMRFTNDDNSDEEYLKFKAEDLKSEKLNYFNSRDFCRNNF